MTPIIIVLFLYWIISLYCSLTLQKMNLQVNRLLYWSILFFVFISCNKTTDDETPPEEPVEENGLQAFDLLYVPYGSQLINLNPTLIWGIPYAKDFSDVTYTICMDKMTEFPMEELPTTILATGLTSNIYKLTTPLEMETFYHWYVIAESDSGSARASQSVYDFRTGTGNENQPPGPFELISPNDSVIVFDDNDIIRFYWEEPLDMDGFSTEYLLFHGLDSIPKMSQFDRLGNGLNNGNVGISWPVNKKTTFFWRILALDRAGNITWSNSTLSYTIE